jgi:hypothetical protein
VGFAAISFIGYESHGTIARKITPSSIFKSNSLHRHHPSSTFTIDLRAVLRKPRMKRTIASAVCHQPVIALFVSDLGSSSRKDYFSKDRKVGRCGNNQDEILDKKFGLRENDRMTASIERREEAKTWKRGTKHEDGVPFPSHVDSRTLEGIGEKLHFHGIVESDRENPSVREKSMQFSEFTTIPKIHECSRYLFVS